VPRQLYAFYFRHVLPLVGCVVSKHMTAYRYLPDSVRQAPQDGALVDLLERSGFDGVRQQRLTAGIASLYWGDCHLRPIALRNHRAIGALWMGRRDPLVLHDAQVVPDVSSVGGFGTCWRRYGRGVCEPVLPDREPDMQHVNLLHDLMLTSRRSTVIWAIVPPQSAEHGRRM
jgi:hypothetical protein